MRKLLLCIILCGAFFNAYNQSIQVVNGISPNVLVLDTFIRGCVSADNINFIGGSNQISYFNSGSSSFPFKSGILLTTGESSVAEGPNDDYSAGGSISPGLGDSNLNSIATDETYDAAVLEFDFIPSSDTINFRYIFASEEYDEYVNSTYNDVFAFFLTGTNPNGVNYNNTNIALIPGTTTTVAINNVNNGYASSGVIPSGPCENCEYYHNNLGGQAVQYDGYTTPLTAQALVVPCETYHIKIAVADVGDHILDSGVFLESGSFSSGGLVSMNNFSQIGDNSSLYEGCTNYYVFSRVDSTNINDSLEVLLSYSGTAIEGVDISTTNYLSFPTSFWIPAGEMTDTIFYTAHNDGLLEGTETIVVSLLSGCPCNLSNITDTIYIYDADEIKGGIQEMQNEFCNDVAPDSIEIFAEVSIDPNAFYVWSTGETGNIIHVPPTPGKTWYSVTISDPCGNVIIDSIPIIIGTFEGIDIDILQPQCHNVCNGEISVTPINGVLPYTYKWIPSDISTSNVASNLCAGNYKVTVTDSIGCKYYTQSWILLSNPNDITTVSSISSNQPVNQFCEELDSSIVLTAISSPSSVMFTWNTGAQTSSIVASSEVGSATYSVIFEDICGNTYSDEIQIKISNLEDPVVITTDIPCGQNCTGQVDVTANGAALPLAFQWEPSDIGTSSSGSIDNLCEGEYFVTVTDDAGCIKTTSFSISEPSSITISTVNLLCYNDCNGVVNVGFENATPPFSYQWEPSDIGSSSSGYISSLCEGEYTVTVTDSLNCSKSSSFSILAPDEIVVSPVELIQDSANQCIGSAIANVTGGMTPYSYNWSNADSTQQVTNLCTGTYTITIIDANGCSKSSSIFINDMTGIEDLSLSKNIKIYPNPVDGDFLNIEFVNDNLKPDLIELIDIRGEIIYSSNKIYSNIHSIEINNLKTGVYAIRVSKNDTYVFKKVVVKN